MKHENYEVFKSTKNKTTSDCTIRALMKLEGMRWEDAYIILAQSGLIVHDVMNATKSIQHALGRRLGYQRGASTKPGKGQKWPRVAEFVKNYPNPNHKLYIFTTGHVIAAEGGKYFDSWDSGNCTVRSYFFKEM